MNTLIKFLEPDEKKMNKKNEKEGLVVTVSGLSGSGKTTVAKMIAEELGLRYICPTIFYKQEAERTGKDLNDVVEKADRETDYEIERRTLGEGMKGNVVLDSRLAGFVMGGLANFKLFVTCSDEVKAKRITQRENMSEQEALEHLKKRDEIHATKYKRLYGVDISDTSIYDMVFDNSGTVEEMKEKVQEIVNRIKVFG